MGFFFTNRGGIALRIITLELFAVSLRPFFCCDMQSYHTILFMNWSSSVLKVQFSPPAAPNGNARALQAFNNNLSHSPDLETLPRFSWHSESWLLLRSPVWMPTTMVRFATWLSLLRQYIFYARHWADTNFARAFSHYASWPDLHWQHRTISDSKIHYFVLSHRTAANHSFCYEKQALIYFQKCSTSHKTHFAD